MSPFSNVSALSQKIVQCAKAEWARDIHEAPGSNWMRIREYLKTLRMSTAKTYMHDGDAEWCGAFAGYIVVLAGVSPDLVAVKKRPEEGDLASTYRMLCLAKKDHGLRYVSPEDTLPGDVCSFGRTGVKRPKEGEHIEVCIGVDEDSIETIGGNAYGTFPDGGTGQGVILRQRPRKATEFQKGLVYSLRFQPTDAVAGK